jgi:hypothetical protein
MYLTVYIALIFAYISVLFYMAKKGYKFEDPSAARGVEPSELPASAGA